MKDYSLDTVQETKGLNACNWKPASKGECKREKKRTVPKDIHNKTDIFPLSQNQCLNPFPYYSNTEINQIKIQWW